MIVFIGSGLLIGGLLGARFSVLAVIPASALAIGIAGLEWVGHPGASEGSPFHIIVMVAFLQIGYLCGAGLRLFLASLRVLPQSNTRPQKAVRIR